MPDRTPPYSEDAERDVLGSILLDDKRVIPLCVEAGLSADAFYMPCHKKLYTMCMWLNEKNRPVDIHTVLEPLRTKGRLDEVGGEQYVLQLAESTPTSAHCEHYIDIVMSKYRARQYLSSARETEAAIYDGQELDVVLPEHMQAIQRITERRKGSKSKQDVLDEVLEQADRVHAGEIVGVPTPFPSFTMYTGGFPFGLATLLIGRSKTRKSYLVHQCGLHASLLSKEKVPGAYYPLEDGQRVATLRAACALAGYDFADFRRGRVTDGTTWGDVRERVRKAGQRVVDSPYEILSGRGMTLPQRRLEIAKGVAQKGWRYVIFDALKDLDASGGDPKEEAKLAHWVCDIAAEFDIAVILVHHLMKHTLQNRAKKTEWPERIIKQDARGSSQITDACRLIVALQCQLKEDPDGRKFYTNYVLEAIDFNFDAVGQVSLDIVPGSGLFTEDNSIRPFSRWTDDDTAAHDPWYIRKIRERKARG